MRHTLWLAVLALAGPAMAQFGVRSKAPGMESLKGGSPPAMSPAPNSRPPTAPPMPPVTFPMQRPGTIGFDGSFIGSGRSFIDSSGVSIDGSYSNDNFRLGFHVGSPFVHNHHHNIDDFGGSRYYKRRPRVTVVYPWWWYGNGYYRYPYTYRYAYIDGAYSSIDPNLSHSTPRPALAAPAQPTQPLPPMTDRQIAEVALYSGQPDVAAEALRKHLDATPDDGEAMRLLALALLDGGSPREAVAMMGLAYRTDPGLASRPFSRVVFGGSERLRRNAGRASIFANREGTASAWLAMAVLVQAQGKDSVAVNLVERARKAGLDPVIADRLAAAVSVAR